MNVQKCLERMKNYYVTQNMKWFKKSNDVLY